MQVLGNAQAHIKTDEIRQLQRSHRMVVTEFHRRINVARAGDALLDHAHRFQSERNAQTARRESRHVLNDDRLLAHFAAYVGNCLYGLVTRFTAYNNLHEPHDVHRIEEVHAHDRFWTFGRRCDFGDRQRRSIARKNE